MGSAEERKLNKYRGIFPAFYAAYDDAGNISPDRVRALVRYLKDAGVQGLYVGGSSGECIYQNAEERMQTLETVMEENAGELTIIAHVACPSTADSQKLAAHAQSLGVDAIAAIPPLYYGASQACMVKYWNDISAAAPATDFFIYNIPQNAGVALTVETLREMQKNPRLVGVKNSSLPTMDIQRFADTGVLVMNGPDEQLLAGLAMGAVGGIGGTYGVMPRLYARIYRCFLAGEMEKARLLQNECCRVIYLLQSGQGAMFSLIKETLRILGGPDLGIARPPFLPLMDGDRAICEEVVDRMRTAEKTYI